MTGMLPWTSAAAQPVLSRSQHMFTPVRIWRKAGRTSILKPWAFIGLEADLSSNGTTSVRSLHSLGNGTDNKINKAAPEALSKTINETLTKATSETIVATITVVQVTTNTGDKVSVTIGIEYLMDIVSWIGTPINPGKCFTSGGTFTSIYLHSSIGSILSWLTTSLDMITSS